MIDDHHHLHITASSIRKVEEELLIPIMTSTVVVSQKDIRGNRL